MQTHFQVYNIFNKLKCKRSCLIYLMECTMCKRQYKGNSKIAFNIRLNNHRSRPIFRLPDHNLNWHEYVSVWVAFFVDKILTLSFFLVLFLVKVLHPLNNSSNFDRPWTDGVLEKSLLIKVKKIRNFNEKEFIGMLGNQGK